MSAAVENSPAGKGQPKPEAILRACRDEWLEQPVANLMRNAGPESSISTGTQLLASPGFHVEPPLHARTYQRQLDSLRRFEQDLSAV
jgi:hypothetical protein